MFNYSMLGLQLQHRLGLGLGLLYWLSIA